MKRDMDRPPEALASARAFMPVQGKASRQAHGFTLIEVSIVLVVASLIMVGGMLSISAMKQTSDRLENTLRLEAIEQALYGFIIANGRLPCPADPAATLVANMGVEARTGAVGSQSCALSVGLLPWVPLSVNPRDAWDHWYTYYVTGVWADDINLNTIELNAGDCTGMSAPSNATATDCTFGSAQVREDRAGAYVIQYAPAIVVSHGRLAEGAYLEGGLTLTGTSSVNQEENFDGDEEFIERDFSSVEGEEFDDQVIILNRSLLLTKLKAAGRLP